MEPIVDMLKTILVEKFDVPATSLTPATRFEEFDFDSLVLVELAVTLENRFGIRMPEGELHTEQTLGEAAALLNAKGVVV
ncbi:acyl carrier protein [Micromonosporaceae bacterium Da 78-11]